VLLLLLLLLLVLVLLLVLLLLVLPLLLLLLVVRQSWLLLVLLWAHHTACRADLLPISCTAHRRGCPSHVCTLSLYLFHTFSCS
jgi:hypothetical protein